MVHPRVHHVPWLKSADLDHWFSTGVPWPIVAHSQGPQHVSRVGHGPLCILKMGRTPKKVEKYWTIRTASNGIL